MLFADSSKYSWLDIENAIINGQTPNLLLWAAGPMLFFMFVEMFISWKRGLRAYGKKDLIGSVSVGAIYLVVTGATKGFTFFIVWWVYYYLAPLSIPATWWSFILCLVVYDFLRYWAHRIAHEQRFWWATHITHHSSEHFNLTVSFRLSWVDQLKLVFFLPLILLGFDPIQFYIIHQLAVLYQYWQHTELIGPLPRWFEYIFVTPTSHRVHHGKNENYIDKNYGSTFIFWDRMFGTYQEPNERPIYGIKGNVDRPSNPFYLVFHEWRDIAKDLWQAKTWKDRYRALFSAPGAYTPSHLDQVSEGREMGKPNLQRDHDADQKD